MHIPENYLSPSTCAVMTAVMLPVWGYSINKIRTEIPKAKMPLLGIGAAFSFLGMMFNVPLPGGTTGHAVGGTLIAILTGSPAAGCISVSIALLIQALLFGDGGILAFGANCFNMAFVLPYLGFFLYQLLLKKTGKRKLSAAIGAYVGINAAAFCAAVEFGIQPLLFKNVAGQALYCPYPLSVLAFVEKVSPAALDNVPEKSSFKPLYILIGALIVLTPIGLLATGTAWGEWGVDEMATLVSGGTQLGYTPSGMESGFELSTLFPDYSMTGMPEWTGYILSAVVGVALLVIFFKIISSLMKDKVDFKKKAA